MRPPATHPFLEWDGPIAFAHRGGASDNPENTMPAFQHAVDLGYTYLETDLRATSDGVCVAFHDARLDRVTQAHGRVRELPWRELRRVLLADGAPIPRLDDLLGDHPGVRVNVDAKEAVALAPLVDVLRRTRAHDRVCVTSFSGVRLRSARRALGPSVATSLAPDEVLALHRAAQGGAPATRLAAALTAGAVAAQVPERVGRRRLVTPAFVAAAHDLGLHVHVWTIDDPTDMERLLDVGVDGIMTDRPTTLRDVLRARATWVGREAA